MPNQPVIETFSSKLGIIVIKNKQLINEVFRIIVRASI
jgi:hypothetical protein